MYPNRDFRYLVNQPNISHSTLITALKREPFPEILYNWTISEKPNVLLNVYQKGIEEAIAKNRYPLYQLEDIKFYPEFWSAALNGLKRLWISLRFSLSYENLLIDSINGQNINITPEDKLQILRIIPYRMSLSLVIDGNHCTIGVFTSKQAEQIYQLVNWLEPLHY